ncbi:GNAT family N-acetyltransferase [Spirosoma arcticum]
MKGSKLDSCLSNGYFRMQQKVFTCQFEFFGSQLCSVLWLRVVVANVSYGKDQRRLLRVNEKFSVAVTPFVLSDELEGLYAAYRNSVNFDAPDSVESCLLGGTTHNAFMSHVTEVRDNGRLIAAGIFDDGSQSIAGIMNFYHPAYRKHSLGKYLMLQKINYAQAQQKTYYYPGYIAPDYAKFDYKLFACEAATEVFDSSSGTWLPFSWETATKLSAAILNRIRIGSITLTTDLYE